MGCKGCVGWVVASIMGAGAFWNKEYISWVCFCFCLSFSFTLSFSLFLFLFVVILLVFIWNEWMLCFNERKKGEKGVDIWLEPGDLGVAELCEWWLAMSCLILQARGLFGYMLSRAVSCLWVGRNSYWARADSTNHPLLWLMWNLHLLMIADFGR